MSQLSHQPIALIILDGFGHRTEPQYNAIAAANMPNWNNYWQNYPHTLLVGSGHAVGLPEDQMGNSEVGHLTMGAGRTVYQELTRIDKAIEDGDFFRNPVLLNALQKAKQNNKAVHLLGLISPGGVHSHERHIHAMIDLAAQQNINKLFVHAFLDGRDVPPQSAQTSLELLEKHLEIPRRKLLGMTTADYKIVSIIGRYYAMDRDNRWDRVQQAYDLLTLGKADYQAENAVAALQAAYARGETDEFVKATSIQSCHPEELATRDLLNKKNETPVTIQDGDVVIFMNYRADRAREITRAFVEKDFSGFTRTVTPQLASFVSLTQYAIDISTEIAYAPQSLNNVIGEYVAAKGITQLRIAETEKYAHVTFFFNGGREQSFNGEDRILVPSPKVATYDLKPEMSAIEVTDKLVAAIHSKKYGMIICNFANPDMVGHTGNFDATVKAVEVIDQCLGRIITALKAVGGEAIITADHGNAECMYDEQTKQPHTAHTHELVPFVYIGRTATITDDIGTLADVAPTLLYLMGLSQPVEMTGRSLIEI
jgi:2,3-bisphosphoglycerate-independent phosphoglycerate mutase